MKTEPTPERENLYRILPDKGMELVCTDCQEAFIISKPLRDEYRKRGCLLPDRCPGCRARTSWDR